MRRPPCGGCIRYRRGRIAVGPGRVEWSSAFCLLALVLFSALPAFGTADAPAPSALTAPFPWGKERDAIAGWTIVGVERTEVFARLKLRRDGESTEVEVNRSSGDAWSSRDYRVQPAPGSAPPRELLRAVLDDLRAWEQRPDHTPFLSDVSPPHGVLDTTDSDAGRDLMKVLFSVLLAATALAVAATVHSQWKERPQERNALYAACALIGLSSVLLVVPAEIPVDWVVPLKNGTTRNNIGRVFGRDLHAGPGFVFLTDLFAPGSGERIRQIARMNLWLAAVNTVLFACLARALAGGVLRPVLLTLWFAANWASWNAAFPRFRHSCPHCWSWEERWRRATRRGQSSAAPTSALSRGERC